MIYIKKKHDYDGVATNERESVLVFVFPPNIFKKI